MASLFVTNHNYHQIFEVYKPDAFNPLTVSTAIWWFTVITHAAVSLTPLDVFLYAFQYPVCLF